MQLTPWTMYWITRLDGISVCLAAVCLLLMAGVYSLCQKNESDLDIKTTLWLLQFFTIAWVMTPTTNQMKDIIIVPKIINSDVVNELSKLAKEWAKEQTKAMEEAE